VQLPGLQYSLKNGAINSVSPGVFFLYSNVTLASAGTITVTESATNGWNRALPPATGSSGIVLYNQSCVKVNVRTSVSGGTITLSSVPAGSYILGIKYDPTSLKGYSPPATSSTYTFNVSGGVLPASASIQISGK